MGAGGGGGVDGVGAGEVNGVHFWGWVVGGGGGGGVVDRIAGGRGRMNGGALMVGQGRVRML